MDLQADMDMNKSCMRVRLNMAITYTSISGDLWGQTHKRRKICREDRESLGNQRC
jgi:hypothetical protein